MRLQGEAHAVSGDQLTQKLFVKKQAVLLPFPLTRCSRCWFCAGFGARQIL